MGWLFLTPLGANGPPIRTETAFTTGLTGAAMQAFFQEDQMSGRRADGSDLTDSLDRRMTVRMVPVMIPYEAIQNRLVVGPALPWLEKRMETTQGGVRRETTNSGFGDLSFFAKIRLFQKDGPGTTIRIAGKFTLKLPTGKDDSRDETGALLAPGLQLGSGSVDFAWDGVWTQLWKRFGFNLGLGFDLRNEANGFDAGERFRYDAAFAFRLLPQTYGAYPSKQLNLFWEMNGSLAQRDTQNNAPQDGTGGHRLAFAPGIQFMGGASWLAEFSYQFPVLQDVAGTFTPFRRSIRAGVRWLI